MHNRLMRALISLRVRGFVLLLSAATFGWGMQAKLSLYESPTPAHLLMAAKLMQDAPFGRRLDNGFKDNLHSFSGVPERLPAPAGPLCFAAVLLLFLGRACVSTFDRTPHALYFRPPPAA